MRARALSAADDMEEKGPENPAAVEKPQKHAAAASVADAAADAEAGADVDVAPEAEADVGVDTHEALIVIVIVIVIVFVVAYAVGPDSKSLQADQEVLPSSPHHSQSPMVHLGHRGFFF